MYGGLYLFIVASYNGDTMNKYNPAYIAEYYICYDTLFI